MQDALFTLLPVVRQRSRRRLPAILCIAALLTAVGCGGAASGIGPDSGAGNPARVTSYAGNGQSATVGTQVVIAPALLIVDMAGRGVNGVEVLFRVTTGGGTIADSTSFTTSDGVAILHGGWTLGPQVGLNELSATVKSSGVSGNPITFSATGTVGGPTSLALIRRPSETASSGVALATQPSVRLQDALGNNVDRKNVPITASLTSAQGTLSGMLTISTDSAGVATFTNLTISGPIGPYSLALESPGLSGVSQSISLSAGPAAKVVAVAGDGQTGRPRVAVQQQPSVKITDASGNPIVGTSVAFAVASGGGTVSNATVLSGPDGTATVGSWVLGPISGLNSLSATVAGAGISGNPVLFQALAQGDFWVEKAALPSRRILATTAAINKIIYVAGGLESTGPLNTMVAYDPSVDAWTSKAPMPTARYGGVAGVVNGILYITGGFDAYNQLTSLEAYDPATNTWTTKAPIPGYSGYAASAVVNSQLFVIGGLYSGAGLPSPSVYAYDPGTDTWTQKANAPIALFGAVAAVINGKIYLGGGATGRIGVSTPQSGLYAYDPATDRWSTMPPMTVARTYPAGAAIDSAFYVVAGDDGSGAGSVVEAYDATSNSWSTKAAIPTPRTQGGAVSVDGLLYVIGGTSLTAGSLEVYQP